MSEIIPDRKHAIVELIKSAERLCSLRSRKIPHRELIELLTQIREYADRYLLKQQQQNGSNHE